MLHGDTHPLSSDSFGSFLHRSPCAGQLDTLNSTSRFPTPDVNQENPRKAGEARSWQVDCSRTIVG